MILEKGLYKRDHEIGGSQSVMAAKPMSWSLIVMIGLGPWKIGPA